MQKVLGINVIVSFLFNPTKDRTTVAYFAFKPSPDPTYLTIYEGAWSRTFRTS